MSRSGDVSSLPKGDIKVKHMKELKNSFSMIFRRNEPMMYGQALSIINH